MKINLKKLIKSARKLRFDPKEKDHVRERILMHIKENPLENRDEAAVYGENRHLSKTGFLPLFGHMNFKPVPIFMTLALILVAGGTAFASEKSLPGDALWPVKVHVNENVRSILAFSPEKKAEFEIKRAGRRIEEIELLETKNGGIEDDSFDKSLNKARKALEDNAQRAVILASKISDDDKKLEFEREFNKLIAELENRSNMRIGGSDDSDDSDGRSFSSINSGPGSLNSGRGSINSGSGSSNRTPTPSPIFQNFRIRHEDENGNEIKIEIESEDKDRNRNRQSQNTPTPTPTATSSPSSAFQELHMRAELMGPAISNLVPSGHADFEVRQDRTIFSTEVEDVNLPMGTSLTVTVGQHTVGTLILDEPETNGGDMNLDSRNGNFIPQLSTGDMVLVKRPDGSVILSGTLQAKN